MPALRLRGALVLIALLTAVVVFTIISARLLFPSDLQGERFNLSVGFILFAECVVFGYPIMEMMRGKKSAATLPFNLGMSTVTFIYLGGVLLLSWAAFYQVPYIFLFVSHGALLVLLFWALGVWYLGASYVGAIEQARDSTRSTMIELRAKCDLLLINAHVAQGANAKILKDALETLKDDIRYSVTASSNSTEAVEVEMGNALDDLAACIAALSNFSASQVEHENLLCLTKIQELRQLIQKRETLARATFAK